MPSQLPVRLSRQWNIFKQTFQMRLFGLLKIPLIFYCRPSIVEVTDKRAEVVIPLNYFTRNHVKSMYFGALCIGADLAAGVFVLEAIRRSGRKVNFIFKDFKADFLKLALADVHFICEEGRKVADVVKETIRTKKRANTTVLLWATTPKKPAMNRWQSLL